MNEITQSAFFNELEKIAQDDAAGNRFITKDRLKRLLKVMGATAVGAGLGGATGIALAKSLKNSKWANHPTLLKVGPAILGGGIGLGTMLSQFHRDKADRFIEHGKFR